MDLGAFAAISPTLLLLSLGIALLAGVVKGVVGFAMPLILVSGISSFSEPKLALAAMILPALVTNGLQTFYQGLAQAMSAIGDYWRFVAVVCVMIFLTAQWVPGIPDRIFFAIIGVPTLVLSAIQLWGRRLTIPARYRRGTEWVAATIAGTLGGLSGIWGPATVLYLTAVETPKARQMVIQGVVYLLGSITLCAAHLRSGILNTETAIYSGALVPAALVGMWFGFKIQNRMDQARFRQVTLIVLVIAGLNLVRKGMVG